ncbi:aryl-alcohol dehydrogenase-like predicted oxidoreductase [Kribbella voronezhensis]|uniref:Aryl-alcohol dehydrogenase-like predicted oxidoreductase n=1 Tax=Kribbella voronezhensis TaxID=2512212 RepID=A0A4R7STU6_9ACTN|nr:aldo/keto reductase [Kribbella voronezhensis]TDU82225.1 aryl-alcohol dehydrogenase-like predicted oxidoreductase [Kribbella voronezhensis]
MQRRILGATGLSVGDVALGAMMFGTMGNPDHEDSVRIIHRALDAGINLIDTADMYSGGESEEIVGTAIRTRRDEVVLASKFGLPMGADPNQRGASRRWIVRSVENSLRRLGTDHLDLYQLHRPDHGTDVGETLAALSDLVQAGKILAFGSSMFPAETIVEGQWAAERRSTHRFLTEQTMYSIFTRRPEASVFPVTQRYGIGVLTFSPLNGGWLSGRANLASSHRASVRPSSYDPATPTSQAKAAAVAKLTALADEAGLTLPQLAIAFVRAHPAVTSVLIGPRTQEQLDSLLPATELDLSPDLLDRIDEIVPPGTELDPADNYHATPPAIEHARLRRR